MGEHVGVDWEWTPFEEPSSNASSDDEELAVPATNIDPRPLHTSVVEIDKDIQHLEDEIRALRLRRIQVLAENALINSLLPEILARIFELMIHENPHIVLSLSLVSRYWRSLVLATPTLWSYVVLDSTWGYGRATELRRKVQTYMERSRAAKIYVDLDFQYIESPEQTRELFEDVLGSHLRRCFSFRCCVPDWEWMVIVKSYTVAEGKPLRASLEHLALRVDAGNEDLSPVQFLEGLFPRLTSIVLEQTPLTCVFGPAFFVPAPTTPTTEDPEPETETMDSEPQLGAGTAPRLPRLKQFQLLRDDRFTPSSQHMHISLRDLLRALHTYPYLTSVHIQNATIHLDGTESLFFSSFERDAARTRVHSLRELSVSGVESVHLGLLLDCLDLPHLKRLAVQMDFCGASSGSSRTGASGSSARSEGDNPAWLARLAAAAQGGFVPRLKQLELHACATDGAALATLVSALHALSHTLEALAIVSPPSGNAGTKLFELFAADEKKTGRWLLPRLSILKLVGCKDVTGHEVLRVARIRMDAETGHTAATDMRTGSANAFTALSPPNVVSLRRVRLVPSNPLDPEVREQLSQILDEFKVIGPNSNTI